MTLANHGISSTLSPVSCVPNGRCLVATTTVAVVLTICVRLTNQLRARNAAMPPIKMAITRMKRLFARTLLLILLEGVIQVGPLTADPSPNRADNRDYCDQYNRK